MLSQYQSTKYSIQSWTNSWTIEVSEDLRRVCGTEAQIFTVSLGGANILSTPI
jgi:hypothetical protein